MNLVALVEERESDCPLNKLPADVNRVSDGSSTVMGSTEVSIGRILTIGGRTSASSSSAETESARIPSVIQIAARRCNR